MTEEKQTRDPWVDPYEFDAVYQQADIINSLIGRLQSEIERVITPEVAQRVKKVYTAGCGDSFYAGIAARMAFHKYAGVDIDPQEAMEFSRYIVDYVSEDSLVFAISNSGQVSRVIEAAVLARQRGAYTVAVTGYPDGPLAQSSDAAINQAIPEMSESWGPYSVGALSLGNFVASQLVLFLCSIRLGLLKEHITVEQADEAMRCIEKAAQIVSTSFEQNLPVANQIAAKLWHFDTYFVLGAGPSCATGMFACAKLFEQPNLNGVFQELEEWAHEQYFLVRPNTTAIFFIAPPGRSRDRVIEQIHGAKDMGAIVISVCDSGDEEIKQLSDWCMPIYGELPEEFTPLTYIVPNQLFATALHKLKGRPPLIPPYDKEQMVQVNYRQIFHSNIKKNL